MPRRAAPFRRVVFEAPDAKVKAGWVVRAADGATSVIKKGDVRHLLDPRGGGAGDGDDGVVAAHADAAVRALADEPSETLDLLWEVRGEWNGMEWNGMKWEVRAAAAHWLWVSSFVRRLSSRDGGVTAKYTACTRPADGR